MNRLSVLNYMGEIKTEPYIHSVGELSGDLQKELALAWPGKNAILRGRHGDNVLIQYQAKDSLLEKIIPNIWREFIAYHTSQEFFNDLTAWCPHFDKEVVGADAGVRFLGNTPVQMESQFCLDTPVINNPVVKQMHLDSPTEFYKFLLRFPGDGYDTGGELEIGTWKEGHEMKMFGKHFVNEEDYDVPVTLPNAGIIFFMNGPDALHGVTPRPPNGLYRRYFNIVGETTKHQFESPFVKEIT